MLISGNLQTTKVAGNTHINTANAAGNVGEVDGLFDLNEVNNVVEEQSCPPEETKAQKTWRGLKDIFTQGWNKVKNFFVRSWNFLWHGDANYNRG